MTEAYSAQHSSAGGIDVLVLRDAAHSLSLSIAPGIGNMAYELKAGGEDLLWFPFDSPAALQGKPALCGIPFLAPWANRIDGDAYWANGRHYLLNPELGNLRRDGNQKPIHGLLNFSPQWEPLAAGSDAHCAWATSRLNFAAHPALMAQFPFAHTITMTHRLANGALEVETTLDNHSAEPMPVAIGYHPYFRLPGAPRDAWQVHLSARDHLVLDHLLIPTGERRPVEFQQPHPLSSGRLDDVFGGLIRDPDGRARFWVEAAGRRLTMVYGEKYTVAVVYAPPGKEYICFEPMAAVTNAFNLAHAGKYAELQSVAPGGQWRESFWVEFGDAL
jgi:aldose 1-epimerase